MAVMLIVGAVLLWLADRWGGLTKGIRDVTFPLAFGIGAAQALALIPGISRSGVSISAGRFAGLAREPAARFSFLMATPVTAGAAIFEARKLATGEAGVTVELVPLLVGMIASFVTGVLAIRFMLRYLQTRSLTVFVVYRLVVAAVVIVVWLR